MTKLRGLTVLLLLAVFAHTGVAAPLRPAGSDAVGYLSDLIRINTVNPPGNERAACDYLAGVLRLAGIEFQIYESTPGRGNIVARIRGDGSKKPILLLAHLDTVGVEFQRWTFPPFAGEIRDGYVHGRGAIDDKSMVAAFLSVLVDLKRSGKILKRDVLFAATADEESGAQHGIQWLLKRHPRALDAEFGISEGGSMQWKDGKVSLLALQALEKVYFDIRLTAQGGSGHASVSHPPNAIFMLGRALSRIESWERPLVLNDVTSTYLEEIARYEDQEMRSAIEDLLSDEPERFARGSDLLGKNAYYAALLQDTIVPTMIRGGIRENVVSSEASLNLNVRLLPDTDPAAFLHGLFDVIGDPGIDIEVVHEPDGPAPEPMPLDDDLFTAMVRAGGRMFPGAAVVPSMSVGSTDAEFLRRQGMIVYGLAFPMSYDDESRIHGHDERIAVESLNAGMRLTQEILKEIAE